MLKKWIALFLSLSVLISAIVIPAFAQETNNSSNADYVVYDLETGEVTYHSFDDLIDESDRAKTWDSCPGYYPDGVIPPIDPNALVGEDNRTRVTNTTTGPYNSTVYMTATFSNGSKSTFSAFMIGPSAAVTAGHCVYDSDKGGVATSVTAIPGKNGSSNPYGSATSSKIIVSPQYEAGAGTNYDWAIIELNSAIGNKTGWLGIRWQSTSYNDTYIYNSGYPSASTTVGQLSDQSYMFVGRGYVKSTDTYTFIGDWDATGGNSGGPVFSYYNDTGYTLIGILTAGSGTNTDGSGYPIAFSKATRITQDMYELFVEYR